VPAATFTLTAVAPLMGLAARNIKAPPTVRKLAVLDCAPSTLTVVVNTGAGRTVKLQVATELKLEKPMKVLLFSMPVMAVVEMPT